MKNVSVGYAVETTDASGIHNGWSVRVGESFKTLATRFSRRRIAKVEFEYLGMGVVQNVRVVKIM